MSDEVAPDQEPDATAPEQVSPAPTRVRAFKTALDPTVEQSRMLSRQAGAARWAYNWALAGWKEQYAAGAKPSWMSLHKQLTQVKKVPATSWLLDVSAYVVREALHDLGRAYQNFFRRLKEGQRGKAAGEPRFRSRNEPSGRGFRVAQPEAVDVRVDAVKVAGIGWIKLHEQGYIPLNANYRGLSCREVAGRWYVAVQVEEAMPAPKAIVGAKRVGVEIGVRHLAVTSDGQDFDGIRNLKGLPRLERRLALWQRRMARVYKKGVSRREQSGRWKQSVRQVAKYNAQIADLRRDTLQQVSTRIVRSARAETLIVRDMKVQKMIGKEGKESREEKRTRNAIAPMVAKVGFYELRREIEYKAGWAGGKVVAAPNDYPSSRRCSVCGVTRETEPGYPTFSCPACGHSEDRETNSAKNLRDFTPGGSSPKGGNPGGARRGKKGKPLQPPDEPGSSGGGVSNAPSTSSPDGAETSALGSGNRAGGLEA